MAACGSKHGFRLGSTQNTSWQAQMKGLQNTIVCLKLLETRTLLGAPGIVARSKDATRGSWLYYWEQGRY